MTFIGKNIKFLREQQQLPDKKLAMMCNMTVDALHAIENNSHEPNLQQLVLLAEALNYPIDRLIADNLEKNYYTLKSFDFKFLALDIDGVLTNGGMYYTESGDEFKKFDTKDGLAIKTLIAAGNNVGFLSSGINSNIIEKRAQLLGVQKVYVGTWKKLEVLEGWCKELNIGLENVAYVGDDVNDLQVIQKVGLSACPADAVTLVKEASNIVLSKKGGCGCVREFIEKFLMDIR
ncbi:MAG TPA: HAD hydrolase family protein [Bacteroidales bacterium]|nr:HAD hydrolase family protein [Bacteroidales bacterium]HPS16292.1 HAD hydrolase family protein [Bacteroidales bacterium]